MNGFSTSKGGTAILGVIAFVLGLTNVITFLDSALVGNVDVLAGYSGMIFVIAAVVMCDVVFKNIFTNRDIWIALGGTLGLFSAGLLIFHWTQRPIMTGQTVPVIVAILIGCIIGTVHVARKTRSE